MIDTVELNATCVRSVQSSDRSPETESLSDKYSRKASDNDHLAIACYTLTLTYTIIICWLNKLLRSCYTVLVVQLPFFYP